MSTTFFTTTLENRQWLCSKTTKRMSIEIVDGRQNVDENEQEAGRVFESFTSRCFHFKCNFVASCDIRNRYLCLALTAHAEITR
jgi:hypothetical protein